MSKRLWRQPVFALLLLASSPPLIAAEQGTAAFAWVVSFVEWAGVGIIVLGAAVSTVRFALRLTQVSLDSAYQEYRTGLGRAILLGLEFLVAADIIRTVAVDPTFRSVGILAAIVLIRTFLSFSLEVEITGRWPWQSDRWRQAE